MDINEIHLPIHPVTVYKLVAELSGHWPTGSVVSPWCQDEEPVHHRALRKKSYHNNPPLLINIFPLQEDSRNFRFTTDLRKNSLGLYRNCTFDTEIRLFNQLTTKATCSVYPRYQQTLKQQMT